MAYVQQLVIPTCFVDLAIPILSCTLEVFDLLQISQKDIEGKGLL